MARDQPIDQIELTAKIFRERGPQHEPNITGLLSLLAEPTLRVLIRSHS